MKDSKRDRFELRTALRRASGEPEAEHVDWKVLYDSIMRRIAQPPAIPKIPRSDRDGDG